MAIPFSIALKENENSRETYINNIIDDYNGIHTGGEGNCNSEEAGGCCFQLENKAIYDGLLMPQEFCGGNGWPNKDWGGTFEVHPHSPCGNKTEGQGGSEYTWDVQNCCNRISDFESSPWGIAGGCVEPINTNCTGFCSLAKVRNDSNPLNTPIIDWADLGNPSEMQSFIDSGSCLPHNDNNIYVEPTENFYSKTCGNPDNQGFMNWCSGRSMHFDGAAFGGDNPNLNFTIVHCNISKIPNTNVGIKVDPKPPPSFKPNQLVIKFIPKKTVAASITCEDSPPSVDRIIPLYEPTPFEGSSETEFQTKSIRCFTNFSFHYTSFEWDDSLAQWVIKESEGMVETPKCTSVPVGDGNLSLCTLVF